MRLRSNAFSDEGSIPRRFTCEGEDVSPPHWSDAPAETRSFAILCEDPDAPAGTWHHWAAYDIAAESAALPEDARRHAGKEGLKEVINDFGRSGYGGPCPPRGGAPHHYDFRLLALSTDRLRLGKAPSCRDVEREARKYLIAETILVGLYER